MLVFRDIIERLEGVFVGVVKLVGYGVESIYIEVVFLLKDFDFYRFMLGSKKIYGDGNVVGNIVCIFEIMLRMLLLKIFLVLFLFYNEYFIVLYENVVVVTVWKRKIII